MRMPARITILLLCACILGSCRASSDHSSTGGPARQASAAPPESGSGPAISVTPPVTAFGSSDDVRFWLSIHNPLEAGCRPLFLDPRPIGEKPQMPLAPRPHTVIELTIRAENGNEVKPRWSGGEKASVLRPHELLLLHCGHGYAWQVWPGRLPWGYAFTPGRYTVRVSVSVPVGAFFAMHDGLEAKVTALWEPGGEIVKTYIRDVETAPAEVTFVVAKE